MSVGLKIRSMSNSILHSTDRGRQPGDGDVASRAGSAWELAAENIAVKIRWFGVVVGYVLVNLVDGPGNRPALNAILGLGAAYALADTYWSLRGRVLLNRWPMFIAVMEALFIGLLCYFDRGIDSAFRFYYILSLVSSAVRCSARVTYLTCLLHCASLSAVLLTRAPVQPDDLATLLLTAVALWWVTWASTALSALLKRTETRLGQLNAALEENQALLEERIAERTQELQEAQAGVLHQEKMAAFGLLAAGVAHEVGNPLASISSLVQMLQRRIKDMEVHEKLALVASQLARIQTTLRELVDFSRPANREKSRVQVNQAIDEALSIAKYYKRTKGKRIETDYDGSLPALMLARDPLVQVFLNLILNAIDATSKGGKILIRSRAELGEVRVEVSDDGVGIERESMPRVFQPYFTTKPNGTGLGLFVSRRMVSEMGGRLELAGTSPEGTTFVVRLPAARVESRELRVESDGEVGARGLTAENQKGIGRWQTDREMGMKGEGGMVQEKEKGHRGGGWV